MISNNGKSRSFFRSPLFLFLIFPLLVSAFIHLGMLIYASLTPWHYGFIAKKQEPKTVLIDIQKKEPPSPVSPEKPQRKEPPKPRQRLQPRPVPRHETGVEEGKKDALRIMAASEGANWLKVDSPRGSAGGSMLHAGPQGPTQTFAEYIEALRSSGLDVVIVFDSSASMKPMMREIKQKIGNLALALRRLVPSCRIGLVTYRDRDEDSGSYTTKIQPLTYGVSTLQRFLNGVEADGGGDLREAVDAGLQAAVEQMNWNRKSKPFILLVGDAPPHKPDIPRCIALAKKFRKQMGGTVSALDVREPLDITREQWEKLYRDSAADPELETYRYRTDRESVDDTFQSMAEAGGGESARLINEEKLIKHMLLYIFGTQWEAYLTEIMKNL